MGRGTGARAGEGQRPGWGPPQAHAPDSAPAPRAVSRKIVSLLGAPGRSWALGAILSHAMVHIDAEFTNDDKLLDEGQAALYLSVSTATLRKWRDKGRGPAWYKLGRLVRYRLSDLDQYLEAARVVAK